MFISNTFISTTPGRNWQKNQANAEQDSEAEDFLLGN